MSTMTLGYQALAQASGAAAGTRLCSLLRVWQQRAHQRRQLLTLSDRQLDDIGISREQADGEAAKPFWQA